MGSQGDLLHTRIAHLPRGVRAHRTSVERVRHPSRPTLAYEAAQRELRTAGLIPSRHALIFFRGGYQYLTAPDCLIWTAISEFCTERIMMQSSRLTRIPLHDVSVASAAVPGILNPVVLMNKTKSGDIVPWNWGTRFKDGSLRCVSPVACHHPRPHMC